jgi:hypothetical protein
VTKIVFAYGTEIVMQTIRYDNEEYKITASMPYGLLDAVKEQLLESPNFGRAYEFLTRGYLQTIGVLKRNETLLDRVTTITLTNGDDVVSFGCSGDCQPALSYASPWTILQDFIDFFSRVEDSNVRVGVCKKVVKPETEHVTIQEYKSEPRPTGKMQTVSSCS